MRRPGQHQHIACVPSQLSAKLILSLLLYMLGHPERLLPWLHQTNTSESQYSWVRRQRDRLSLKNNSGDKKSKMARRKQVKPKKKKRTVIVQLHKKTRVHPLPGLAGLSQRIRNEQQLQKSQR